MTESKAAQATDPSKTVWAVWVPILCTIAGLVGGGISWGVSQYKTWQSEQKLRTDENARLLNDYLLPIQSKLKLNLSIFKQLDDQRYAVPGNGILESYMKRSEHERDPKKLALQFGLIADLVQQNDAISDLLGKYRPFRLTKNFITESDKFLEHAETYNIRFKALPDLAESGGTLPSWIPFPDGFPSALEDEIAARRSGKPPTTDEFDVIVRLAFRKRPAPSDSCKSALHKIQADYPRANLSTSAPKIISSKKDMFGSPIEYNSVCVVHVKRAN